MKKSYIKPLDVFNSMLCDNLITCITPQANLYAAQQGKENLNAEEVEIATVIAKLLLLRYRRVPQRNLYRAASPDFFELFLHLNVILYFCLFFELFDKNRPEKFSVLNLFPNVQVKQQS